MSTTLNYRDTIQRVGYTTIGDVPVVQYTCIIPVDQPKDMRISIVKMDADLYKVNRGVCRSDYAEFEDAAYELQENCMSRQG